MEKEENQQKQWGLDICPLQTNTDLKICMKLHHIALTNPLCLNTFIWESYICRNMMD